MKKYCPLLLFFVLVLSFTSSAQKDSTHSNKKSSVRNGFGIKAGLNFANVTNLSSINGSSETGFHAGVFFGSFNKGIIGSRTELMYSQQGYGYSSDTSKGTVKLSYIQLAQFFAINASKYVQIQIGFQTGYLLTANVKSSMSTGNAQADKILDFYNRFDYGISGGFEIHPFEGLLIGSRYTYSFSNLYKNIDYSNISNNPSYVPSVNVDFKNNVVQIFVGYRF
ncbi:MAG: PorT family protein [Bacteroidetes bacterium]|nr:PorT family protein [Bacteroidota bacterium]